MTRTQTIEREGGEIENININIPKIHMFIKNHHFITENIEQFTDK